MTTWLEKHDDDPERVYTAEILGPVETQGSKSVPVEVSPGRFVTFESKKGRSYRQELIREMRLDRPDEPLDCAVELMMWIYVKRPQSHYRTGKYSHILKPTAPKYPGSGHDLDKVYRLIGDAAKIAGWIKDDARISDGIIRRRFTEGDEAVRSVVTLRALRETVGDQQKKVDLPLALVYDSPDDEWADTIFNTR